MPLQDLLKFEGEASEEGRLLIVDRERFVEHLKAMPGKIWVTVERYYRQRSDKENKYYWGVVVDRLRRKIGYTKDEMHDALKLKFLLVPAEGKTLVDLAEEYFKEQEIPKKHLDNFMEFLRNAAPRVIVEETKPATIGSTRQLTTVQMEDYLEEIRQWAAQEQGLDIPLPNEPVAFAEK